MNGSDNRIAVARHSSELYYSEDNGSSFEPLGSQKQLGSALVGLAEDGTQSLVPLWASTGLETMWMQGFYFIDISDGGLHREWRLFSFTNDGGLFFSDDGGVTWVHAQPNVPTTRVVPAPTPDAPFIGGGETTTDVTAMASRRSAARRELLLATCTVGEGSPPAGRVVLSRDGGWSWTGRALCGLPEGPIWAMTEAGGAVYVTVGVWGVFVLRPGSYTWEDTGEFRYPTITKPWMPSNPALTGVVGVGSVTVSHGVEEFPDPAGTVWRSYLNPQHLAVVTDSHGRPRWLMAGLVADGHNRDWNSSARLPGSVPGAGLWRLSLGPDGLPAKDAAWVQIAGLNIAGSFPNAWRAMTGLASDGASGVVVSLEESWTTFESGNERWLEGGVVWCEDVGVPAPVFRLVLTHPKACAIAMYQKRLFVGLGRYDRMGYFSSTYGIPVWQPREPDSPLIPSELAPGGYSASKVYFKQPNEHGFSEPSGPIGVFEVTGSLGTPFMKAASALPTQETMQSKLANLFAGPGTEALLGKGGWRSPPLLLVPLTNNLVNRNLRRPLALQVHGKRMYIGLAGSGSWSRPM